MGAVIKIHHPNLTPEERAYRMEKLKQAVIKFHREVISGDESKKETKEIIKHN